MRCGGSGIRAFFFAPVPAFGWFRILRVILLCLQILTVVAHLGAGSEEMSQHYVGLVAFAAAWGLLGSELEVHWNKLSGASGLNLGSAQQIIALMIGARFGHGAWRQRCRCQCVPECCIHELSCDGTHDALVHLRMGNVHGVCVVLHLMRARRHRLVSAALPPKMRTCRWTRATGCHSLPNWQGAPRGTARRGERHV